MQAAGPAALASQVRKDGQHTSMVLDRGFEPELGEDRADVALDRLELDGQPLRDGNVRASFRHQAQDLPLSRRQLVER